MVKMKLEYITSKSNEDKSEKYQRYAEYTLSGDNNQIEIMVNKFEDFLLSKGYSSVGCPADEINEETNNRIYIEDILIEDKEEFEKIKEIWKEFKNSLK